MIENTGLSRMEYFSIIDVFSKFADIIEEVILFGSRARGSYKKASDVDLAVKFRSKNEDICLINEEIFKLDIIYTFDLIDFGLIHNEKLLKHINDDGRVIFKTNVKGEVVLSVDNIIDKYDDFSKALNRLKISLERDYIKDDIVIDAVIQRFEFTYELAWKLLKAYLNYSGNVDATSPRGTIKEAYKDNLIVDNEGWIKMLLDRNRTVHTYDEESALEIYLNIKNNHILVFDELDKKFKILLMNRTEF